MNDLRLDKLAQLLVQYSTAVRPGELVSLLGPPVAEPLLVALYREVLRAGGHPIVVMTPEACDELLYRHGSLEQLAFVSPLETREAQSVDVTIHVLATRPGHEFAGVDPSRLSLRATARRVLRETFLHRVVDRSVRWAATVFPCHALAEGAGLSAARFAELVFAACLLDESDPAAAWRNQRVRQAQLVEVLRASRELRIVTPAGTDVRLGVAGRTWMNGDGRENLPDGEVYTAPLEDATEGTVSFDLPAFVGDREIRGIRLAFHGGRVVQASATTGEAELNRLLDQDAGTRVLGEVGFGCNERLTRPMGHPLLDEKIAGTFHLALGTAYPGTGGRNVAGFHCDLIGDLRCGGRVEVDGQPISGL